MVPVKILYGFFLLWMGGVLLGSAQTPPAQKTPPAFSLLNLVRSPQPASVKIGAEPVGLGQMPFGFYTGAVSWLPFTPILVEAPGFGTLQIPVPSAGGGECPLFVVQDALEKPVGGGEPKPVLKYVAVPNAKDRPSNFTDGLNLTSRETLTGTLGGKTVSLEKGKRSRLSTANGFFLKLKDAPEVSLSPSEDPGGFLIVFYENLEGKIEFAVTNDFLIRF